MTTDADVLAAINVEAFPDGLPVNQQALFGNTIEYDGSGDIVFARALFQVGVGAPSDRRVARVRVLSIPCVCFHTGEQVVGASQRTILSDDGVS